MKRLIAILTLNGVFCAIGANATTYYVSPSGSDSNPGTISQPFASWQKLSSVLKAGDIAYIRGGTYRTPKAIGKGNYPVDWRNLNGTSSSHIIVSAYPGEYPVLNLDNVVETVFVMGFYMSNCSYIDLKGLRITGLKQPSNGQNVEGWRLDMCNQITLTQCEVDHIQGVGYRVTQTTPTSSVFTFTNCDSHDNGDPYNGGGGVYGNADGFDANGGSVTYIGCRAWWNSDDGFDTYGSDALVTYQNCWSFWNGFIPGTFNDPGSNADGDGYKWGSTSSDLRTTHLRTYTNCVAFQNKSWGFDQNAARCVAWFYNTTSYQNGYKNSSHPNGTGGGWATGYSLSPPVAIVMKNDISYNEPQAVNNLGGLNQDHNTWDNMAASSSSFASLDTSGVTRVRQSDGSLPSLQFLHLSANSNLINVGVSISGLLFSGSAPDLGAFEYSSSTNQSPVANAGTSQTIVLPTNSVTLNGSASHDPDGNIKSYSWSEVSGPSSANISTPTQVSTNVTTLVQGTYTFKLVVTDDKGATGSATVTITVNSASQGLQSTGSSLTGSGAASSSTVNLTSEGTSDWAHWSGYDHKSTGGFKISNYTVIGSGTVSNYSNDPRTCTWSDGTPTGSGSNRNGIFISGIGKGFQIMGPADPTQRTLRVYVGGWASGGTLTASLSDGSAPDFVNTSFSGSGQYNAVYTLTYTAASTGRQIIVKWVQASGSGNVTLQAATLAENTTGLVSMATNTAEVVDQTNLNEKPSFVIYPNPVRDNFVLQLNNNQTGKMNVQVVNQAGEIIRSYLFNKDQAMNQVTVSANDLPTGIYFVHVQIGTWSDQRKIVKL